jgi:hypothetical protein
MRDPGVQNVRAEVEAVASFQYQNERLVALKGISGEHALTAHTSR